MGRSNQKLSLELKKTLQIEERIGGVGILPKTVTQRSLYCQRKTTENVIRGFVKGSGDERMT